MKLIIAEKPSLAQAIRDVLPANSNTKVTHCYGHMLELADPAAYDDRWIKWNVADLPIRVDSWKLVPKPSAASQLQVIAGLIANASQVIHAGDPDREGQLLVDEVLDHVKWTGPVHRLLVTAADPETVRKALAKLEDNAKYQGLRQSAECRQRADWLVGMNLTRAVTRLLSTDSLISIGRVQTPTLALVVRRHLAIANFTSEAFWTLRGRFLLSGGRVVELRCEPDPRITDERQAAAIGAAVKGLRTPLSVEVEQKRRLSPLPFHLGDFQKAAERHFGWGIAKSLEALQAAYEAKLTSYPRVECRYLPVEQMGQALTIATKVGGALKIPQDQLGRMQPKKRVYDSSQVEVHHGIVPTGVVPGADIGREARLAWELVSLHFLRTLLPDESYEQTEISVAVNTGQGEPHETLRFTRKAERPLNTGENWKIVDIDARLPPVSARKKKADPDAAGVLPATTNGEMAEIAECRLNAGKTTPPDPYTESTLREDMSSVAKYVEDPRLKATLKETSGLGTPATQANIIETLKKRGYIQTKAKNLIASDLGIEIIRNIPQELADPGITAAWEDALRHIAVGEYSAPAFMQRVDQMIDKRIAQTFALKASGQRIKSKAPEKTGAKTKGARASGAPKPRGAPSPRENKAAPPARSSGTAQSGQKPDLKGFF